MGVDRAVHRFDERCGVVEKETCKHRKMSDLDLARRVGGKFHVPGNDGGDTGHPASGIPARGVPVEREQHDHHVLNQVDPGRCQRADHSSEPLLEGAGPLCCVRVGKHREQPAP